MYHYTYRYMRYMYVSPQAQNNEGQYRAHVLIVRTTVRISLVSGSLQLSGT